MFLRAGLIASGAGLAGCVGAQEGVTVYSERTEIEVEGENGVWKWIADIDHSYAERTDVEVTITLYDTDRREITTFTRVVNNIDTRDSDTEYEVAYIASPEVINSIVDYDVELVALTAE